MSYIAIDSDSLSLLERTWLNPIRPRLNEAFDLWKAETCIPPARVFNAYRTMCSRELCSRDDALDGFLTQGLVRKSRQSLNDPSIIIAVTDADERVYLPRRPDGDMRIAMSNPPTFEALVTLAGDPAGVHRAGRLARALYPDTVLKWTVVNGREADAQFLATKARWSGMGWTIDAREYELHLLGYGFAERWTGLHQNIRILIARTVIGW